MWRQEQLEIVCTKILNFLPANLWRNPWLHQEWPSKGLNFAALQRLDKRRLAESDVFWRIHHLTVCFLQTLRSQTTWIFTSGLTVPQPTVKHPPSVMVWGCFSSQSRGGLYFLPKGQTMNASRNISVLDDHLQSNFDTMPPFGTERKWHSSEGGIITRICKNSLVM